MLAPFTVGNSPTLANPIVYDGENKITVTPHHGNTMEAVYRSTIFITCVCLLVLQGLYPAFGQQGDYRFHRYTGEHGLSQNTITAIYQDKKGFMWLGTQDGLNRFDGYSFKIYKKNTADPNSLSENWIWSIFEDSEGIFWIGTFGGGLNRLDPRNDRFTIYRHQKSDSTTISSNVVWSTAETSDGILWVAANNGLNRFDRNSGQFQYILVDSVARNVFNLRTVDQKTLWMTSFKGLHHYNPAAKELTHYISPGSDASGLTWASARVNLSFDNRFWLSDVANGLRLFNPADGSSVLYRIMPSADDADPPNRSTIRAVAQATDSTLWIGSTAGVHVYKIGDRVLNEIGRIRHDRQNPRSLTHDYINQIFKGQTDEMWVGCRYGLNRFDPQSRHFERISAHPNDPASLSNNQILPILEDRSGTLWVGTSNGLNRRDAGSNRFRHYFQEPNRGNSLVHNYILSLHEDSSGQLWIGTRNGLSVLDRQRKRFRNYYHQPGRPRGLESPRVHYIHEDAAGNIWLGTGGGGLHLYNPQTDSFIKSNNNPEIYKGLTDPFIFTILSTPEGPLWLGTADGGLYYYDYENNKIFQYEHDRDHRESLSNNRVLAFLHSRKSGDIWIGTADGLNRLIPPTGKDSSGRPDFQFRSYNENSGLPNSVIYGILEEAEGKLWVSTNKGLSQLTFQGDSLISVRTLTADDGLQSNEFSQNAFFKNKDGKLYFGGVNGLTGFYPEKIASNDIVPKVVITDFKLFNESVSVNRATAGSRPSPLQQYILETENITLSHQDDLISFEFAALNYILPEKNRYAYKMEGFDKNWINSGERRFATYTNLDPGDYTFRVRASNNDGIWNEQGAAINITITPPPWQTWWAYLLYTLAFFSLIIAFVRYKVRQNIRNIETRAQIERAKLEERERVRKKTSADFHDEAGTLLTKITLYTEMARRKLEASENISDYLSQIEKNTKSLSHGMRDFIWVLDPEKDSLMDTAIRLQEFGTAAFEDTDIQFQSQGIISSLKHYNLQLDERRAIVRIFKEAMNNCLKHSQCKAVNLELGIKNDMLEVCLSDDGIGFVPHEEKSGYGLQNMARRAEKSNGKLIINANKGQGTKICYQKHLTHIG